MDYKHTVMGGTFDRLHAGHISNIKKAFETGEEVTIGLTTEKLHGKKILSHIIQPYEIREKQLLTYMSETWPDRTVHIQPIDDMFGPSITDWSFDSIVVTKETFKNGRKVNERRARNGLTTIDIITAPWLVAEDGGTLSSTRIRLGEIDSQGNVHERHFKKTLHLPDSLREAFKKAPGQVVRGAQDDLTHAAHDTLPLLKDAVLTIAVGDIVSDSLQKVGYTPTIKIIDYKNQRKSTAAADQVYDAKNAPGTINPAGVALLMRALQDTLATGKTHTITIDGEEDLLVPPAILLAPLGSVILHGQAGEGIAVTPVAEDTKREILHLIRQFTS